MNKPGATCKYCQLENPPDAGFCSHCGMQLQKVNRVVSIWRSIAGKWGLRSSIVLLFAATPICMAMVIYRQKFWTREDTCDDWVSFEAHCASSVSAGFLSEFILFCALLAILCWFTGLIVFAVLSFMRRESGRAVLGGMAMGSGAATITLLVSSIASYFFIDWARISAEKDLIRGLSTPAIRAAVDAGADINVRNDHGETPLHRAGRWGEHAVILALLDSGADIHAKDDDGHTPLHAAAMQDDPGVIRSLLDAGADIEAKSEESDSEFVISSHMRGETPLHKATRNGSPAALKALLHAGADINAKNDRGETPLHSAAAWGGYNERTNKANLEMIQALLDAGADINAKDVDGNTPLDLAKSEGNPLGIRLLEEASGS